MDFKHKLHSGFTLVELSIVLVIIGLIIGSVLVGQSLIKQAGIRAVIEEINNFKSGINAFRLRYNFLPGDFPNATSFLSGTNNGNGNGIIEQNVPNATTDNEAVLAWQHMSLIGAINGNYTGVASYQIGVDMPASNYGHGSGWYFDNQNCYPGKYYMTLGQGSAGGTAYKVLFTPIDMYTLDSKIDDGLPQTGTVLSPWYDVATPGSCIYTCCNSGNTAPCVLTATNTGCLYIFGAKRP